MIFRAIFILLCCIASVRADDSKSILFVAGKPSHAKGAKVDVLSILGGTPLHEAAASSSPEIINLLLKNGANKNIKAANGKTPLDYAIQLENNPVADILK